VNFFGYLFGNRTSDLIINELDLDSSENRELLANAKEKCSRDDLERLLLLVASLHTTSARSGKRFLQKTDVENYCFRATSFEGVFHCAASVTAFNNGSIAELCQRAEILSSPIPHIKARHSWRGISGSFGTNTFYAIRSGRLEFLCGDHCDLR
jgi:hypothetical protein